MVTSARFERATPRLGIWCSIQLSYEASEVAQVLITVRWASRFAAPYVSVFRIATIPETGGRFDKLCRSDLFRDVAFRHEADRRLRKPRYSGLFPFIDFRHPNCLARETGTPVCLDR